MSLSPKLVETLLFGTERQRRFTQDSPVLPDVWLAYNQDPCARVDLLLTPYRNGQPAELYTHLRARLKRADRRPGSPWAVTYNESYAVAKLTFRELIRAALPLTRWWAQYVWPEAKRYQKKGQEKGETKAAPDVPIPEIETAPSPAAVPEHPLVVLRRRIKLLLDCGDELADQIARRRAVANARSEEELPAVSGKDFKPSGDLLWMIELTGALALEARREKPDGGEPLPETDRLPAPKEVVAAFQDLIRGLEVDDLPREPLLWAVNLNRDARSAIWRSSLAVKADAARLLFHISCKGLRWAVLDSGIDATHPAFRRRQEDGTQYGEWWDQGARTQRTRVVETYDFTRLRSLLDPEGISADETTGVIRFTAEDRRRRKKLTDIHKQVEEGRMLDWDRLAELIRVPVAPGYPPPRNPHGTHVAGILAADWRASEGLPDEHDLLGMCPDLELIDLRVLDDSGQSDEFTVLAALQFIRHLNGNQNKPYVHGVNLSLSLYHNVMNYACGCTPVCEECHRLLSTGTVVVAAAGNKGHTSLLTSKGESDAYQDISITDPGNAEGVITVGATHRNRPFTYGVSYFSSRGPTGDGRLKPDLVAPGEKITGPVLDNDLDTLDGTSMAAPHVSGAAAMLMARHDELIGNPARIKKILCDTATDLGRERRFQGSGMLDVLRALQSV